jgi:hypothetical protein
LRLPEIVAKYQELIGRGVKALAQPIAVAEASEALSALLKDGQIAGAHASA